MITLSYQLFFYNIYMCCITTCVLVLSLFRILTVSANSSKSFMHVIWRKLICQLKGGIGVWPDLKVST